jgi:subtilisin-like proprotein convertase family protein
MGNALRHGTGVLLLTLALTAAASAQTTETQTATPNAALLDDGYLGSLDGNDGTGADAGMTCAALDFTGSAITSVTDVTMDLALSHTFIGDLVVKLRSPSGTILAPLNRPGYAGPDDGTSGVGDSANLTSTSPVSFSDAGPKTAESMGDESTLSAYVVCASAPNNCSYGPSPDGALNSIAAFSGFDGEDPDGLWEVCVGDAAPLDLGTFASVSLHVTGESEPPLPSITFEATVNTTHLPQQGGVLVFNATATNNEPTPVPVDVWLTASGPLNYTVLYRTGTLPPGVPVEGTLRIRVARRAPDGTYNVDLHLGDFDTLTSYASESFVITKGPVVAATAQTKAEAELTDRPSSQATARAGDFAVDGGTLLAAGVASAPAAAGISPNPFADRATVSFSVAETSPIRLVVYDVLGREVAVLVDGTVEAGIHAATFDARGLTAGTYVYCLTVDGQVTTGRLTLAR